MLTLEDLEEARKKLEKYCKENKIDIDSIGMGGYLPTVYTHIKEMIKRMKRDFK